MNGVITNIQRFSVHDGPGIRTTIFLKGCPLSCVWCQNPETVKNTAEVLFSGFCVGCKRCLDVCRQGCFTWKDKNYFKSGNCNRCGLCIDACQGKALKWSANLVSIEDVLSNVMLDKEYYKISSGGVTLSGGEPLQQIDFCCELASRLQAADIDVALETSGCATSDTLAKIAPFIGLFLYDIKFIDDNLHKYWTHKSNFMILENFRKLCKAGKKVIARVPLIPEITDTEKNLSDIKCFINSCSNNIQIDYIPFNKLVAQKYTMMGKAFSLT